MYDFESFVDDMCELYLHACELLENNNWISVEEQDEHDEDCVICYSAMPYYVFVDYVNTDIHGDVDYGTTMRYEFHKDNHGRVTVHSCHKCNQSGCFFTDYQFECGFLL